MAIHPDLVEIMTKQEIDDINLCASYALAMRPLCARMRTQEREK